MNKKNYQKIMEDLIRENCTAGEAPSLLLHSCCAPCSSYCIACLAEHFHVTVFYYNPNIYPPEEYHMRAKEQERFIAEFPTKYPVSFVEGAYDTQRFYDMAKGMEEIPEGESAVLPVTGCGFPRLRPMQKRMDLISLRQHYPSVR